MFKNLLHLLITEIRPLITYNNSRNAKTVQQSFQGFNNYPSISSGQRLSFNLPRDIFNSHQDIFITKGNRKRAHKVNTPTIKDLIV